MRRRNPGDSGIWKAEQAPHGIPAHTKPVVRHSSRQMWDWLTEFSSLPMCQRKLDPVEEQHNKDAGIYAEAFKKCERTAGGVPYESTDKSTFVDTPEEREEFYQSLLKDGGLRFWVAGLLGIKT